MKKHNFYLGMALFSAVLGNAQDENEKHTSSGVFSLITNKWLEKPRKETFKINKSVLKSKIDQWTEKIDKVLESADEESFGGWCGIPW